MLNPSTVESYSPTQESLISNEEKYKTRTILKLGIIISLSAWSTGYQTAAFNPIQEAVGEILGWGDMYTVLVSLMTAIFPLGGIAGAIIGRAVGTKYGRRKSLLIFATIQAFTCLLNLIPNTISFALMRFISGICSGNANIIAPIFIGEMCPKEIRGKITIFYPAAIIGGSFCALAVGIPLGFGLTPWYYMVVIGFPAFVNLYQIISLKIVFKYDSPVWLVQNDLDEQASDSLSLLYHQQFVSEVRDNLKLANPSLINLDKKAEDTQDITVADLLCKRRYRKIASLGIGIQAFNVLGGYVSIVFYSNFLLVSEGTAPGIASIASTGLQAAITIFTLMNYPLIDKFGRRPLLITGMSGMAVDMVALGIFALFQFPLFSQIILIIVFLFFFSFGSGPVGWVYVADISNLSGIMLASIAYWISMVILGAAFPFAASPDGINIYGTFWVFALINLFGAIFIIVYAPEVKGMDKREISQMLQYNN